MYRPEILDLFDLLGPFSLGAAHGHKMAAVATVFRDILISVVPAGVRVTSPTLRCRWRWSHLRQSYIRDSSGSFPYVLANLMRRERSKEWIAIAIALQRLTYPTFVPPVISNTCFCNFPSFRLLLLGAGADSCAVDGCRRHTAPLLRYIRVAAHVGVTSRARCALCAMHRNRGKVNGMHVCENGNLMRREGNK
jgi:hypothetical protein